MATVIQNGFITPDGKVFTTAQAARDHIRAPLVEAALKKVAGGDANLAKFLGDNEDEIMKSFEVGTVARVTKSERNKLSKAMEHLKTIADGKLKFLQDNADAVVESFRWPSVKRLTPEEKQAETLKLLTALSEENAAKWIVSNQPAIEAAYQAGIEKRAPNPTAMAALEKARTERKAKLDAAKAEAAKTAA